MHDPTSILGTRCNGEDKSCTQNFGGKPHGIIHLEDLGNGRITLIWIL
jgi:hypothetical protein